VVVDPWVAAKAVVLRAAAEELAVARLVERVEAAREVQMAVMAASAGAVVGLKTGSMSGWSSKSGSAIYR